MGERELRPGEPGAREQPDTWLTWRVPSKYGRCRTKGHWDRRPVADMARTVHQWQQGTSRVGWWAYCAGCLADLGREVRDGVVWWVGPEAGERDG